MPCTFRLLSTSLMAADMASFISKDKELTGARLSVRVAMRSSALMSTFTRAFSALSAVSDATVENSLDEDAGVKDAAYTPFLLAVVMNKFLNIF